MQFKYLPYCFKTFLEFFSYLYFTDLSLLYELEKDQKNLECLRTIYIKRAYVAIFLNYYI